ncbi:DMT family transporter [Proteinivorax hydrogeniformans]|uniref:DMT family transporter n=1 Tax=Proteinivorax hydrogeniformans TaxID=1826727 RepID=A0AAU8HQP9_9FIRM
MLKSILPLLVAALSGAAMTFQGTVNSALGKKIGVIEMALVVHGVGLAASIIAVVFFGAMPKFTLAKTHPHYFFIGGLLSVVIIVAVAFTIAKTGAALGISVILIAQLVTAVVLDHFGIFTLERIPIGATRIIGTVLMLIGARLLVK